MLDNDLLNKFVDALLKIPDIDAQEVEAAAQHLVASFEEHGTENPYAVMQDIQLCMEDHAGIVRTKEELERGLVVLEGLRERTKKLKISGSRHYNPGWHYAIDVHSMLVVCEAIIRSAINREESRGGHTRLDFPETSEELENINTVVLQQNSRMVCEYVTRSEMPEDLKKLV